MAMQMITGRRSKAWGDSEIAQMTSGSWFSDPEIASTSHEATAEVAERTHLRLWRPFSHKRLGIVCEEVSGRDIRVHVHEEVQISLPLTPYRIVDGLARAEPLGPGCIGIINPGELHGAVPAGRDSWSTRVLLVATKTMARIWKELRGGPQQDASPQDAPWFPRRVVTDEALAAELHTAFEELRRPLTALECESRLIGCLARLITRHAELPRPLPDTSPRCRRGVSRVREYLRGHVADSVSIDQLARVAGLSKYYLLRAFAREYGVSPHAYQMELRLARVRTLLARGTPPSHAAYEAGFADQSHLTRRMRAAFGFTPAAYARQFAAPVRGSPARHAVATAVLAGIETAA